MVPVPYAPLAMSLWGQYVAATFPGSDDLVLIDTGPKDEVVPAPPVVPPTDPEQLLDVLRALLGGSNPAWANGQACTCAEPIDIQSGNNFASWTDLEVPGRGGGLVLERTYNSLDASRDGPLGYGWSANLKPSLVHDTNAQTVTVKHGNGSEVVFGEVAGAPDSWAPAPLFDATLVHDAGGTWTYEVRNQETLSFDASGGLVWEEDRNGNRISVTHPNGQTEVWADEAGRTLTLAYVGGRIHTVTDNAVPPRQVRYEYDGAGDLVDVFDVEGGNWHYTYDSQHRLRTRRSPRQSAKPVGEQKVIENWYDAEGRSYREVDEEGHETVLSWEVAGDVTTATVTESRGGVAHRSRYRYEYGFLVEETHGLGSSDEATTAYRSDPDTGGMTWIRDPRGNVTTQDFDERGNLRYRRDPLGREWYWEYNEFNSPTVVVAPDGHATTNTYDVSGNLTRTDTEYRADVVGTPVARTISTVLHRDDPGHPDDVTAMTDGENKTWTYGYDQYGYRTRVTSPVGATSTSVFDNVGRRLWSRAPEGNEAGDEGDPVEQERWTTHYVTNGFGDVTEVTDPEDNLTVTGYDENRNVTSVTDAKEETTTYVYDDADRLTEEHRPDAEETVLKTEYWEDGLLKAQVDGAGARTEYFYDALGRLSRVEDPLDRETSYAYDDAGNVVSLTDADGQVTSMSYDTANQVAGVDYSDPGTPDVTGIGYDSMGRRTSVTDGTGTSAWEYDTAGQVTSYTNGAGKTVQHVYDSRGLVTQVHYPDGAGWVERSYRDDGSLAGVTSHWVNPAWEPVAVTYGYDANGNVEAQTNANGTQTTQVFDRLDRVVDINHTNGAGSFAHFAYTRDDLGLLDSVTPSGAAVSQPFEDYGYDPLRQLTSVNTDGYGYDDADNLELLPDGSRQAFDAANQLCWSGPEATTPDCSPLPPVTPVTAYEYDSRGNRTQMAPPVGDPTIYGYDQANRLTSVQRQGSGNWGPSAGFSANRATGDAPLAVTFDASSSSDPDGTIVSYAWDWDGDGTIDSTTSSASTDHTYASVGSFTPRLVVTDDEGVTATVTAPVPVVVTDGLPDRVDFLAYGNFSYDHDADLTGGNLTVTSTSVTGTATFGGKNGGTATAVINVTKTNVLFNWWNGTVKVTDPSAFGGTKTSTVYNRQLYPSGGYIAGVATGLDGPGTYTMNWKVWDHPANPPSGTITAGPTQPAPPVGGGLDASYAYDADGLRQSKTVNGVSRGFTWDVSGGLALLVMDGTDVYVYGIGNQPVARVDTTSGATHTLQGDQLGSIRALTDQAGTVVGTYTYDAWGNITDHTGVSSGLGYAGEYRDEETGFVYLRARHYDPVTGQFLTRDPLVASTREAYGYTDNTPVNGTDPSGMLWDWLTDP